MREKLKSRLGFLMLAAGSAVGLGNVWRFPYVAGRNGGAAFVVVYLAFLAILGFPLLAAELGIGRGANRSLPTALGALAPPRFSAFWRRLGTALAAGCLVLMIYYTDVAGWLVKYAGDYALSRPPADPGAAFAALAGDWTRSAPFMLAAVAVATAVCLAGVVNGVERVTKCMMLSLLALLGALAARAVLLPGAAEGLSFYLKPDWAKFMEHPWSAVFDAMGQAFFTLSLGIGSMTICGSYVGRDHSLVKETALIILIDTVVAILAGFVVFPACATYGIPYESGPGLVFVALPRVFAKMPGGTAWGFAFFLFLSFAALTTVIAVFECMIAGLSDSTGMRRSAAALLVGAAVAAFSMPCVLFEGVLEWEDFAVSQIWLPAGALAQGFFVSNGTFGWGWEKFRESVSEGAGAAMPQWMKTHYAVVMPVLVLIVFAAGLYRHFA
jgi:NSS family neurotransmitter:Na+ symporter